MITLWMVFAHSGATGRMFGVDLQGRQDAGKGMKGKEPKERQHEVMGEGRTGDGRTF